MSAQTRECVSDSGMLTINEVGAVVVRHEILPAGAADL